MDKLSKEDQEFIDGCNFCVLCALDGEVVHMVLYETKPEQLDLDLLREELSTDKEINLCDVAHELEFKIIEKP